MFILFIHLLNNKKLKMKNLEKTLKLLIITLILTTTISCSNDDDGNAPQGPVDIVALAQSNPDLSILVDAVIEAGLADDLMGTGPFTVFAPTDEAFQAVLDENGWSSAADIPDDLLLSTLLFHVIPGEVKAADLTDTYAKTLATGPNNEALSLLIQVTGGVEFNDEATPVATDVEATNGVVHVINKVMGIPNILSIASGNDNFSILVDALTDSRHTTDFISVLQGDGPFTVFAPTNDAFQALLDSNNDWNSLADIPIETLDAVLKYHVVNGANVQADQLTDDQSIQMLGSGSVTIDLSDGAKIETSSGQSVNILVGESTNDVQGTNGVVHAIDAVLLPGS